MAKRFLLGLFLVLSLALPFNSWAAFSNMISFGDSLSDNGISAYPYDMEGFNTFSNGDVWVDYLAGKLGIDHDGRAYGGARTGTYQYDLLWQIDRYAASLTGSEDLSNTLVTVWAGGNDLRDLANGNTNATPTTVIGQAITNLGTAITDLYALGVRNILIPNLPDLGLIPEFNNDSSLSGLATMGTNAFNSALSDMLAGPMPGGLTIYSMDVYTLFYDIIADGIFSNTSDPWLANQDESPSSYLFYDSVHPTTEGHWYLAGYAAAILPTPVPSAFLMMGTGLVCLVGLRRKTA